MRPELIQNEPKQPKTSQNSTNDPKGDLSWPKTTQNKQKGLKTSQNDPKGHLNWRKTTQNKPIWLKQHKTTQKKI